MLSEDIHILFEAKNFLGLSQEMYWRIKTCLYNDLQFFLVLETRGHYPVLHLPTLHNGLVTVQIVYWLYG